MAEIIIDAYQPPAHVPPPLQVRIKFKHVVYRWNHMIQSGDHYTFDQTPSGFYNRRLEQHSDPSIILIPIDPLTAIGLGLVKPEELGYPAGILAAFNILSKEPTS